MLGWFLVLILKIANSFRNRQKKHNSENKLSQNINILSLACFKQNNNIQAIWFWFFSPSANSDDSIQNQTNNGHQSQTPQKHQQQPRRKKSHPAPPPPLPIKSDATSTASEVDSSLVNKLRQADTDRDRLQPRGLDSNHSNNNLRGLRSDEEATLLESSDTDVIAKKMKRSAQVRTY